MWITDEKAAQAEEMYQVSNVKKNITRSVAGELKHVLITEQCFNVALSVNMKLKRNCFEDGSVYH